jgi:hypothetical protein
VGGQVAGGGGGRALRGDLQRVDQDEVYAG